MKVTAPGKILLLGGYAVLEGYPALSIAVLDNKGMGVSAAVEKGEARIVAKEFGINKEIDLKSPFLSLKNILPEEKISATAYAAAVAYIKAKGLEPLALKIDVSNSPIFGSKEEKSGIGSSAAATVAIVAGIFEGNGLDINTNRDAIHKVAQVSHALATNKVGSGFDVASATYGSIKYQRYPASTIDIIMDKLNENNFSSEIARIVDKLWKGLMSKPYHLEGYDIIAFNIRGVKTSTISSVKAVKQLMAANKGLYLNLIKEQAEAEAIVFRALEKENDGKVREGMHLAREAQQKISKAAEAMGIKGFDPIEPPVVTKLIEKAERIKGVVAGRCPGAGGYDSVAFLVKEKNAKTTEKIMKEGKGLGMKLRLLNASISREGVKAVS
ncbi:MAG: hypothetical protein QW035_03310 [Candidatus Anstonellales archaeon]